jgi:hypothetical protein
MIRVGNWAIDPADAATFVRVNAATSLYLPARILSPDQHDAIWAIQLPQQVGAHLAAQMEAREKREVRCQTCNRLRTNSRQPR